MPVEGRKQTLSQMLPALFCLHSVIFVSSVWLITWGWSLLLLLLLQGQVRVNLHICFITKRGSWTRSWKVQSLHFPKAVYYFIVNEFQMVFLFSSCQHKCLKVDFGIKAFLVNKSLTHQWLWLYLVLNLNQETNINKMIMDTKQPSHGNKMPILELLTWQEEIELRRVL